MKRRLYFLFPSAVQARNASDNLVGCGIGKSHIHALARPDVALDELPAASTRQQSDLLHRLERVWWNANLGIFFVAFVGLLVGLFYSATLWIVVLVAVMIVSLVLGVLETHLPDLPVDALRDALQHGEVLLLIDVPRARVAEIERFIHARHPEATVGGVSWTIERFGM